MSVRARTILRLLERSRDDMLALLESVVEAESPSTVPDTQDEVLSILSTELVRLNFAVTRVPGRTTGGYLYGAPRTRERGRAYQLLLGHCDTVWPLGTLETMPFRVEGGVARGPGVFDMKGGLVQLIYALRTLQETGMEADVIPVVLINSDEEVGSRDSGTQIRRLARAADRAIVLEPALGPGGKLKTSRRGAGKFFITVRGVAAHSGLDPGAGASAILELSHVIQTLHELNDPAADISVNVGMIEGGTASNVVAPECRAVVDVRVATREDGRRVAERIRSLQPATVGTSITVEGRAGRDPMEPTPGNRVLWERAREAAGELGIDIDEGRSGAVSDANTTSLYAPTIDGLGAVGDGAHARHEYIEVDRMVERTALLALMLLQDPVRHDAGTDTESAGKRRPESGPHRVQGGQVACDTFSLR